MSKSFSKNDIYKDLSIKYNIHPRIIEVICNHPFIFAKKVMVDASDEKPLMFHYLGKIKLKYRFVGKKRIELDRIQAKIDERMIAMGYKSKAEYDAIKNSKQDDKQF